jgi:hypothetical protein
LRRHQAGDGTVNRTHDIAPPNVLPPYGSSLTDRHDRARQAGKT